MAQGFYEIDENGVWHEIDPFKKADLIVPVRCKDCKHYHEAETYCDWLENMWHVEPGWFCADGERRDDD